MAKKIILSFFFVLGGLQTAHGASFVDSLLNAPLLNYCLQKGGQVLDTWTCPESKLQRTGPFCKLQDSAGKELIFNGCTNVYGEYGSIFLKACVLHDLCYHNEPASTGKQKADCDQKLYADMMTICTQTPGEEHCKLVAESFFFTVQQFGDDSWKCSKGSASYPGSMSGL
jgi:hypothetical protein